MPRGSRNLRQVWKTFRAMGRLALVLLVAGSGVFFMMTFGPRQIASDSAIFFLGLLRILGIVFVIGAFLGAIKSLIKGE